MAKYVDTFESETIGAAPSNWTHRWNSTNVTTTVADDGSSPTDLVLRNSITSPPDRILLSYDAVNSDPDRGDATVLLRCKMTQDAEIVVIFRGDGSSGSLTERGYEIEFDLRFGGLPSIRRLVGSGTSSLDRSIGEPATDVDGTQWFYVRASIEGEDLRGKIWQEGDPEPGWQVWGKDDTFSGTSGNRWIGISHIVDNTALDISFFAVGTGKDAADLAADEVGVRTTQAFAQALTKLDSEVRVTQNFLQAATKLDADANVSQSALLALWGDVSDSVLYSQAALLVLGSGVPCYTRWAQLWTITRTDGQVFRFTTLDTDFTYQGNVYRSCAGLASSASEDIVELSESGNAEINAIINSEFISDQEILAGWFQDAEVTGTQIPWQTTGVETERRFFSGIIGRIEKGTVSFKAEVLTPATIAQQRNLLATFSPSCRHDLGDSICQVDLEALRVSGTVTQTVVPTTPGLSRKRVVIDSSRSEEAGYFNFGILTWVTGDNAGSSQQVETFEGSTITLWDTAAYRIQSGDQYTIVPGCDKLIDTCKNKFANFDNFGGFPHVPGKDELLGWKPKPTIVR